MPKKTITKHEIIQSNSGTISWPIDEWVDLYSITTDGATVLSEDLIISATGDSIDSVEYLIHYNADLDFNNNTFTVFGETFPSSFQDTPCWIRAIYIDDEWKVNIYPSFSDLPLLTGDMIIDSSIDGRKISDGSITDTKIKDGDILPASLGGRLDKVLLVVPVSFDAGETANNSVSIPFNCTIDTVRWEVTKVIENTDNGTLGLQIDGVNMAPSSITINAGSTINATGLQVINGSNTLDAGQELRLVTSKTTPGGKLLLTVVLTRI